VNVAYVPMPELRLEDWQGIAAAIQYAADRIHPDEVQRREWLRLRNVALESAWVIRTVREFEASGGLALPVT
jgi:hypothetical protein